MSGRGHGLDEFATLRGHFAHHAFTAARGHDGRGESHVREVLGLDDAPCWIVVSEHNVDEWPNGGLAPLPGRPGVFSYGFVPPRLFADVKNKFLELYEKGRSGGIRR